MDRRRRRRRLHHARPPRLALAGRPESRPTTAPPSFRTTARPSAAGRRTPPIVGGDLRHRPAPALWTSNGAGSMIPSGGVYTDDCPGEVLAISGDGTRVAGVWCQKAWTWSAAGGVVDLSGDGFGYGQAVALNGQLVFGTNSAGFFDPAVPVRLDAGRRREVAASTSPPPTASPSRRTTTGNAVVAASADGTVVVGTVYDEAFKLRTCDPEDAGLGVRACSTGSATPRCNGRRDADVLALRRPCRIRPILSRLDTGTPAPA